MTADVNAYDRMIIEKNRQYLYCVKDNNLVWHWSPWHAWYDELKRTGITKTIARKIGGNVRKFNPITGEIR